MPWSDPALETFPIDPRLKGSYRNLKIGLILLGLITAITLLGMTAFLYHAHKGKPLVWTIGAASILVLVVFMWFTNFLWKKMIPTLHRASRILASYPPRDMMVKPLNIVDMKGALVELRLPGDLGAGPAWGVAAIQSTKKKPLPKTPTPVRVYEEMGSEDRFVVLDTGDLVLWGHLTTPETREKSFKAFRWTFIGFIVFLALAVGVLGMFQGLKLKEAKKDLGLAMASLDWPKAPGTILSSKVKKARIPKGKGSVPGFKAVIEFDYVLDGRSFSGDTIHLGYKPQRDRGTAEALVAKYSQGRSIQVAYDPDRPEFGVLEPGHIEECRARVQAALRVLIMTLLMGLVTVVIILVLMTVMGRKISKIQG